MSWLRFITNSPSTPKGVDEVRADPTTGVHYETEWAHSPPAKALRRFGVWSFMKPAISHYGQPRVIGADRLSKVKGPVIFAANHHSHADTTLLLATIPAHLRRDLAIAAGADYFFGNKITSAISALFIGAIPIERKKLSKLSIQNATGALERRRSLLIFPEGSRSPDGWGKPHRPGAAFVARKVGAPVVPVYIDGTSKILPKGKNWPTRSPCAVVFGDLMNANDGEHARDFAARIESRISQLADEFNKGWWQSRRNAHNGQTPDITGPEVGAWRRRWALGNPRKKGSTTTSVAKTQKQWPEL